MALPWSGREAVISLWDEDRVTVFTGFLTEETTGFWDSFSDRRGLQPYWKEVRATARALGTWTRQEPVQRM